MNLLKIALAASCAVLLASCSAKVLHTFEYPMAKVELTDGKCEIDGYKGDEEANKLGVKIRGGKAEVTGEGELKVCWMEMDGFIMFIDEQGRSGLEAKK